MPQAHVSLPPETPTGALRLPRPALSPWEGTDTQHNEKKMRACPFLSSSRTLPPNRPPTIFPKYHFLNMAMSRNHMLLFQGQDLTLNESFSRISIRPGLITVFFFFFLNGDDGHTALCIVMIPICVHTLESDPSPAEPASFAWLPAHGPAGCSSCINHNSSVCLAALPPLPFLPDWKLSPLHR